MSSYCVARGCPVSADMLVLTERKGNADNLEPCDVCEDQESLADMVNPRKIPHRCRHAGKTLLEQRMEEFEQFIFTR